MTEPSITPTTAHLQQAFRSAMGNLSSPVSVVTTFDEDEPHGTTVSAFASLSMDPPMVLVSLDLTSQLLTRLPVGRRFGLNVLAAHQDQVALRFAQKRDRKFDDVPWFADHDAPRIVNSHAWVVLDVEQRVPAGDHVLVLGAVVDADSSPGAPLSYHQRTFGTHKAF
jgi:flavin reductase (DIM6/NTAB) family NADH-FMN oxidoreductase RutF